MIANRPQASTANSVRMARFVRSELDIWMLSAHLRAPDCCIFHGSDCQGASRLEMAGTGAINARMVTKNHDEREMGSCNPRGRSPRGLATR